MIHLLIVLVALIGLIVILYISVELGRWFGVIQLKRHPKHKLEVMTVAESSVFGLLALLIAFTFSGAYERYENRKLHVITQANAFDAVYNYLDFVPNKYKARIHKNISAYLDAYLDAYNHIPFTSLVDSALDRALALEDQIWHDTVLAVGDIANVSIGQSVAQAIINVFDTSHTGISLTRVHPPGIIFILMVVLAALGAFLIGYDAAESKQKRHVHVLCYVLLTAFIINIIINLEYPRTGFIRLNNFDSILLDAKNHNNNAEPGFFSLT